MFKVELDIHRVVGRAPIFIGLNTKDCHKPLPLRHDLRTPLINRNSVGNRKCE